MGKILVVDDQEDVVLLVSGWLRRAGHRVVGVYSAIEALEVVHTRGAPDLVVLDVSMPEMDGLALLPKLRSELGGELPAIFLSAKVLPDDIAAGRALGADYLTKPFVASALIRAVDRALAVSAEQDGW